MSEYNVDDPEYFQATRAELKGNYKEFWYVARSVFFFSILSLGIAASLPNTLFFDVLRLALAIGIGWLLYNLGNRFYILHIRTRSVNRLEEAKNKLAEAKNRLAEAEYNLDSTIRKALWGE